MLSLLLGWESVILDQLLKWYVLSLFKRLLRWCHLSIPKALTSIVIVANREIVYHTSLSREQKVLKHTKKLKILFMYWRTMSLLIANGTWQTSSLNRLQESSNRSLTMLKNHCCKEITLERSLFQLPRPKKDRWWCLRTRRPRAWDVGQAWMKMRVIYVSIVFLRSHSCTLRSWRCWRKQNFDMLIYGQVSSLDCLLVA